MESVRKEEVEILLGCPITDNEFEEALEYARRKQAYIAKCERRPIVMEHWYLVKLTEEYVRELAFSRFTTDLCEKLRNMEKEHSVKNMSAHTHNHIVQLSCS